VVRGDAYRARSGGGAEGVVAVAVQQRRHEEQAEQQRYAEPPHNSAALSAEPESVKERRYLEAELTTSTRHAGARFHEDACLDVDRVPLRRYADPMKRLELARVRTCQRCGRGRAELESEDGTLLRVPLDPIRVRELARPPEPDDVRPLADLVLAELGATVREVVIDCIDGQLRALLSFVREGEPDVVACTAQEGIGLAVRGGLRLYATEEALTHGRAEPDSRARGGGPDTLH
jgi:hypothetical protein